MRQLLNTLFVTSEDIYLPWTAKMWSPAGSIRRPPATRSIP